ncbi:flagellar assembly protein FlaJ [Heyndrickxia sporothermodurans]|uniref:flagellar assembly protein FlaJ n=1 Tax=Heyndrickxia sporothermodurans TaxID=46224 RepID=UPI002DB6E0F1|nr:flagellar assembly protein FlaJ [Heyndrickxia sporothermodurans]MEB6549250.1 flagellar assembly protein FlaJ [Heyndrickxia sporothermodurans]
MFFELINESRLNEHLAYFKKEKKDFLKVRMLYGIILTLIAAMIIYVMGNTLYFLALPVLFVIGYKYPYYNIVKNKSRIDNDNSYLFPDFLGSFIGLIPSSGNVYQTLVATLPYTKEPLRTGLEELIAKIEDDNRREHYMDFADYIGTSEAYMVMDMIYQFSEFGIKKEPLKELERFVMDLESNKQEEVITKKMNDMEYLGFLPIFISMYLVMGFLVVMIIKLFGPVMGSLNIGG